MALLAQKRLKFIRQERVDTYVQRSRQEGESESEPAKQNAAFDSRRGAGRGRPAAATRCGVDFPPGTCGSRKRRLSQLLCVRSTVRGGNRIHNRQAVKIPARTIARGIAFGLTLPVRGFVIAGAAFDSACGATAAGCETANRTPGRRGIAIKTCRLATARRRPTCPERHADGRQPNQTVHCQSSKHTHFQIPAVFSQRLFS